MTAFETVPVQFQNRIGISLSFAMKTTLPKALMPAWGWVVASACTDCVFDRAFHRGLR